MESSNFYALAFRMKYIDRWGLMKCSENENLSEHSLETAVIAHALALIGKVYFGKAYDAERAATLAVFHDMSEVYTGDLPTPIKYYNEKIKKSYKEIEKTAEKKLLSKLPEKLVCEYESLLTHEGEDAELLHIVKSADKLTAYIKCIRERKNGNHEFDRACETIKKALDEDTSPEVKFFCENMLESFFLTLDEL